MNTSQTRGRRIKSGRAGLPAISSSPRQQCRLRTSKTTWIGEEVQQLCKDTPPNESALTLENPAATTNQSGLSSDEIVVAVDE